MDSETKKKNWKLKRQIWNQPQTPIRKLLFGNYNGIFGIWKSPSAVWNLRAPIRGEDSETNTASSETNAAEPVKMRNQNEWNGTWALCNFISEYLQFHGDANLGIFLDII
jgi:hypothetical protein